MIGIPSGWEIVAAVCTNAREGWFNKAALVVIFECYSDLLLENGTMWCLLPRTQDWTVEDGI